MKINDSIKNTAGLGVDKPGAGKLGSANSKNAQASQVDAKSAEKICFAEQTIACKQSSKGMPCYASVLSGFVFSLDKWNNFILDHIQKNWASSG